MADEGRREADEATAWTARTENLAGLLGCAEQDVAGSGEAVSQVRVAAMRTGVDEASSGAGAHDTLEGVRDREAWGRWSFEELEKERTGTKSRRRRGAVVHISSESCR